MTTSSPALASSKCRIIYDKHWHGRHCQKESTLSESERIETGNCVLCRQPDSQAHTFQHYKHKPILTLRQEINNNLRARVHQYDNDSATARQIGRALMDLLHTTSEPERIWLGNLSTCQIKYLQQNINPDTLSSLTQKQLDNIFLPLGRILAEGSTNLNHQKLIADNSFNTCLLYTSDAADE